MVEEFVRSRRKSRLSHWQLRGVNHPWWNDRNGGLTWWLVVWVPFIHRSGIILCRMMARIKEVTRTPFTAGGWDHIGMFTGFERN